MHIRPSGPEFGVIAAWENTRIPTPESIAARRCGLRARIVKSKSTSRPALGDRQFLPAVPGGSLSRFVAPAILPPRISPSMAMPGAMRKPAEEAGIHNIKPAGMYSKKSRTVAISYPDRRTRWRRASLLEMLHVGKRFLVRCSLCRSTPSARLPLTAVTTAKTPAAPD